MSPVCVWEEESCLVPLSATHIVTHTLSTGLRPQGGATKECATYLQQPCASRRDTPQRSGTTYAGPATDTEGHAVRSRDPVILPMMEEKQYNTFPGSEQELTAGEQRKPVTVNKGWFIALSIINVVVLITVFVFNGLSAAGPSSGIFVSTPGNQSAKYYLDITPAGWTFSIWGFIYAWQALWVLYSLINLCRHTPQGPAYLSPPLLPLSLFLLYILANGCNIAWLFLFDRDHIEASFAALILIAIFLVSSLAVSSKTLTRFSLELVREGRTKDVWLVRLLVHNGLGIYGTWTCIASLLNLAMVITYSDGSEVSVSTASTIALGILTGEIVVFVTSDLLILDRYSRYTFTPYIVVVVALVGSISKNWEAGATNSVFSAILLALACVALVVKVIVSIYRHMTRPLTPPHVQSTLAGDFGGKNAA